MCSTLGKQLSLFRAKISGFAFSPTSKRSLQVCVVHVPFPPAARKVTATALARYREDDSKKSEMCWYKRKFLNFFFFCQSRRAFSDALLLCLFGGERQDSAVRPFLASSPLLIVKVDVSKISNRRPDYPTLKNNSHEAWKCSVTRKKYFERPHTAVFKRSGWEQHPVP